MSLLGDFAAAEDLVQDAVEIALKRWPVEGIPERPDAWLFTVAKRQGANAVIVADKVLNRIEPLKGSIIRTGVAGTNKFRFTGRLNGKRLPPGKYRLIATPTASGKTGRAASAKFDALDRDHDGTLDRRELGATLSVRELRNADLAKDPAQSEMIKQLRARLHSAYPATNPAAAER